jgi:anaerobic nitric oxide reductase transcription regulator
MARSVRELEHLVSRTVLKALSAHAGRPRIVTVQAATLGLDQQVVAAQPELQGAPLSLPKPGMTLKTAVDAYQKQLIEQALIRHQGKWIDVAREMGLIGPT